MLPAFFSTSKVPRPNKTIKATVAEQRIKTTTRVRSNNNRRNAVSKAGSALSPTRPSQSRTPQLGQCERALWCRCTPRLRTNASRRRSSRNTSGNGHRSDRQSELVRHARVNFNRRKDFQPVAAADDEQFFVENRAAVTISCFDESGRWSSICFRPNRTFQP